MQYQIINKSHNQEHIIAEFADVHLAQKFLMRVAPKFTFQKYELRSKTELDMLKSIQRALFDYKVILEQDEEDKEELALCKELLMMCETRIRKGITGRLDAIFNRQHDAQEEAEEEGTETKEEYTDDDL